MRVAPMRALTVSPLALFDTISTALGVIGREALLNHADRALYAAKATGRNTVCVAPPHR